MEINKNIMIANNLINERKFEDAKKLLNEYIDEVSNKENLNNAFSFADVVEFYSANYKIGSNDGFKWIGYRLDDAYKLLAYISNEERNYDDAFMYLEKGLSFNPLNTELYFEKAETAKFMKDLDNLLKYAKDIYGVIFKVFDLSRYYRLLGFYYIEKEKYDLAYALYAISIHYENSEMAHNEIMYIRSKLNNPTYSLTMKEILKLLNDEKIPVGILKENLEILKRFVRDESVIEKFPKLVEAVSKHISKYEEEINENTIINGLNISEAKISCGDFFDDSKFILDEMDKERIQKNISKIKKMDIPYFEGMKTITINYITSVQDKELILNRALVDYAIASFALLALDGKDDLIDIELNNLDNKFNLRKLLNSFDLNYINNMANKQISLPALQETSWVYEECYILMWALGLVDEVKQDKECNIKLVSNILNEIDSYNNLLDKCNLRSKEEIMEMDDFLQRCFWAITEANQNNKQIDKLNTLIVKEQLRGLDFVLDFKMEKLMKDYIGVNLVKDDFNFNFKIQNNIMFNKCDLIRRPYDLIELMNNNLPIIFTDLGVGDIDSIYEKDLDGYKSYNWNIVGEFTLYSNNIEGEIKEVIITNDYENNLLGKCNYYFLLNGHIVRVSVFLDNNLNYEDLIILKEHENIKTAIDLIFSIEEK